MSVALAKYNQYWKRKTNSEYEYKDEYVAENKLF